MRSSRKLFGFQRCPRRCAVEDGPIALIEHSSAPQAAAEPAPPCPATPKPRPPYRGPGRFDLRQDGGPNRSSIEPRTTGVVGPSGRETGRRADQRRASKAGCGLPAATSPTGLGAEGCRSGAGRSSGADASQGHPYSGRDVAGGAGGVVVGQDGPGVQCLGFLASIRAGIEGTVRAGIGFVGRAGAPAGAPVCDTRPRCAS